MDDNLCSYVNDIENPEVVLVMYILVYTTVAACWMITIKYDVDTSKYARRWVHD